MAVAIGVLHLPEAFNRTIVELKLADARAAVRPVFF